MTIVVTESEIVSPEMRKGPKTDSPAASARARARVPNTESIGKTLALAKSKASGWWAWTARPLSLRDTWTSSRIDPARIPNGSGALKTLWRISNWSDRAAMFVLIMIAPTCTTGALRWIACRPTRRVGFYIIVTILLTSIFI